MDCANASMYDGGSALAEAVLMARAIKGRGKRVVLTEGINPLYRQVVQTYLYPSVADPRTAHKKGEGNLQHTHQSEPNSLSKFAIHGPTWKGGNEGSSHPESFQGDVSKGKAELHQKLMEEGFLFGIRLDRFGYKDQLLIAVTEKRTKEEMDWLVEKLRYNISHEGTSSSTPR